MLKHLGMFGVLAVCLFAMAMVGCSQGDRVQYVYNARGFWHAGEEGTVTSLEESDVPFIISELAEHSIGITGARPPRSGGAEAVAPRT